MPPLEESVLASVSNANFKNLGDAPAFYTALAMGNAVSHQQAMQQVQIAATGQIIKNLSEVDPTEAIAVLKATSGNDLAQQISALTSALSQAQQASKTAGQTPPTSPAG